MSATAYAGVDFDDWTGRRDLATIGTNAGSTVLPFQGWRRFKEAFAPELIERAYLETGDVKHIVDPFGGSGTTSLAAQFLGAHPTTIEVNPFLADLIEAKVSRYDIDRLVFSYARVMECAREAGVSPEPFFANAPPTFLEPGVDGRFLFSRAVASRLCAYREAIEALEDQPSKRLMRVLLASVAVPVSNANISGKGRRYRTNWRERMAAPSMVDELFDQGVLSAIFDLRRYESRRCRSYTLLRGDSRTLVNDVEPFDLSIFSPPYPNSFDYTDVYNIELWALGYLNGSDDNRALRSATLRSHVQVARDFSAARKRGPIIEETVEALHHHRAKLWNRHIPDMVGAYFDDMSRILEGLRSNIRDGGRVYMVVGDSRYAGVDVPVAAALAAEASDLGYKLLSSEPFRSMRASPQQGGRAELAESLVVFQAA